MFEASDNDPLSLPRERYVISLMMRQSQIAKRLTDCNYYGNYIVFIKPPLKIINTEDSKLDETRVIIFIT